MDAAATYQQLISHLQQTSLLASCGSVLGWDEQTGMPPAGSAHRAAQLSLLAGMVHERVTDARVGEWLAALESSPLMSEADGDAAANIREAGRDFRRATKLPRRYVEELSRVTSLAQQAWIEARQKSNFSHFLPWLEQIVALKREEAQTIGYGSGAPYDALLDEYEPGATAAQVQSLFTPLRTALAQLLSDIVASGRHPDSEIVHRAFPIAAQASFAKHVARKIGFDFDAGRLDESTHPFCSGIGPGDTRMTTRYDFHHFPSAFFGVLHESGHGIYDQGLSADASGTPLGQAVSLGIHESQSRLWENFVGRSTAFWQHFYPQAQAVFPESLGEVPLPAFVWAINTVKPSFIRVEADEVTYNLHIMLRFEIEQQLVAGTLAPADVPTCWNELFQKSFNMTPPDDAHGCLQDIHWSGGGIGYFPTYTLGNMYAAQFYQAAQRDLGSLPALFARGEFEPLKSWLNEKIHRPGRKYPPRELAQRVTGVPLSPQPLVDHLRQKFSELYGL